MACLLVARGVSTQKRKPKATVVNHAILSVCTISFFSCVTMCPSSGLPSRGEGCEYAKAETESHSLQVYNALCCFSLMKFWFAKSSSLLHFTWLACHGCTRSIQFRRSRVCVCCCRRRMPKEFWFTSCRLFFFFYSFVGLVYALAQTHKDKVRAHAAVETSAAWPFRVPGRVG